MIAADARSGSTVGKYRLHEIVGRGGMGVVYRAEHVYIGREVAVKILHEGYGGREEAIKRFLREARAASLINHPNIVDVTDFGKANDGTVFFVMELLIGQPLDSVLTRERRLDLLRAITICNQLAAALAAAHHKGIIHRDLKPENVMLIQREGRRELVRRVEDESGAHEIAEREETFDFVKILDFGVAKVREPEANKGRVTQAGVVFGTPEYMAPETARIGFSDARSDVYALGIMFYEMLTGSVPFTGEAPMDVMLKQVNGVVPPMRELAPLAEITVEAERMILKALAKDPDQRHQSMEDFHRDLQTCYGQLRFRRTVRTPTVGSATINTPAPGAIPLTKRKSPSPGALPTNLVSSSSSGSNEIRLGGDAPRSATPNLQASAPSAPILLTKKKSPGSSVVDPAALERTPPPVAIAVRPPVDPAIPTAPLTAPSTPPLGSASHSTLIPAHTESWSTTSTAESDSARVTPVMGIPVASPQSAGDEPPKKKRTTLPLPLGAPSHRNDDAPAAPKSGRPPATPPLPMRGTSVGGAVPRLPPTRAASIPQVAISDRPTPRVAISTHLANAISNSRRDSDNTPEQGMRLDETPSEGRWFDKPDAETDSSVSAPKRNGHKT